MKYFIFLLSSLFINTASADLVPCGSHLIENLIVQADRDDGSPHAQKLLIKLSGTKCNNNQYLYLDQSNPSYNGILSLALSAKATSTEIVFYVNSSKTIDDATEIALGYLGN